MARECREVVLVEWGVDGDFGMCRALGEQRNKYRGRNEDEAVKVSVGVVVFIPANFASTRRGLAFCERRLMANDESSCYGHCPSCKLLATKS
jgi:hypothetical protein